jgi:hypothetical protein
MKEEEELSAITMTYDIVLRYIPVKPLPEAS